MFNMVDQQSQAMAAAFCVKAASALLERFILATLDLCDQEVTVTLVLHDVQTRRKKDERHFA